MGARYFFILFTSPSVSIIFLNQSLILLVTAVDMLTLYACIHLYDCSISTLTAMIFVKQYNKMAA